MREIKLGGNRRRPTTGAAMEERVMRCFKQRPLAAISAACAAWAMAAAGAYPAAAADAPLTARADRAAADLMRVEQASRALLGELRGVIQEAELHAKQIRMEQDRGEKTSAARDRLAGETAGRAAELEELLTRVRALAGDLERSTQQAAHTRELRGQLLDLQQARKESERQLAELHAARAEQEQRLREARLRLRELEQRRRDFDNQVKNSRAI